MLHVFPDSPGILHGEPVAYFVIEDFLWDGGVREHGVDSDSLFVAESIRKSGASFRRLQPENSEGTRFHSEARRKLRCAARDIVFGVESRLGEKSGPKIMQSFLGPTLATGRAWGA